ncbi:hypothetical protein B296_00051784 [Ensete ventricosum]|uniref:Uncharacterized protein n=1 Tax=Ensete ventricosum TaxID=4639 RepID=A0A426X271_ENSVE|nr:hypothetical protein B296_00051784 [Ensete ventricosum]
MTGAIELQLDDGARSSLSIELGFGRCSGISLEFARRFAEEIGKLTGNMSGDYRKKTIGHAARMSEAIGLVGAMDYPRVMLRPGVTQEWVGESELLKERMQSEMAEALRCASRGYTWRDRMIRAAGELDCFSAHIRLNELDKSEDKAEVVGHGQALCKGGQPRPGHPQGGDRLQPGPARKGQQTPVACRWQPAGVVAHRDDACGHKRCPQGLLPVASKGSARGGATRGSGSDRRGNSDDDGVVRVMKGLGHPFEKRMILPLRI